MLHGGLYIICIYIYIILYNIPNIPSLIGGLKWCPFSAIEMMVQIHHFSHPDPVCNHHCRLVRSRLRMSVLRCQLRRNCDLYSKNRWALRFQYCSMTAVRRIAFLIPFFLGCTGKKMENMRREKSHDISTSGICPGGSVYGSRGSRMASKFLHELSGSKRPSDVGRCRRQCLMEIVVRTETWPQEVRGISSDLLCETSTVGRLRVLVNL